MKKNSRYCCVSIGLILCLFILGKCLDLEAERVIQQMYLRDKQGIILGAEGVQVPKIQHPIALVFLHGFLDTPAVYKHIIQDLKSQVNADIYAPLLPYHGRDLVQMRQLNNANIRAAFKKYLFHLSTQYHDVLVVAHSYSGTLMAQLSHTHELPHNVYLVLYAPAIYIYLNTPINRIKNSLYQYWRTYCNYPSLGCARTFRTSDPLGYLEQIQELSLQYKVMPAVTQLFNADLAARPLISSLSQPFHLLIAIDDNRVSYPAIQRQCHQNSNRCHLIQFDSGKHMPHYGKNKHSFETQIMRLVDHVPSLIKLQQ